MRFFMQFRCSPSPHSILASSRWVQPPHIAHCNPLWSQITSISAVGCFSKALNAACSCLSGGTCWRAFHLSWDRIWSSMHPTVIASLTALCHWEKTMCFAGWLFKLSTLGSGPLVLLPFHPSFGAWSQSTGPMSVLPMLPGCHWDMDLKPSIAFLSSLPSSSALATFKPCFPHQSPPSPRCCIQFCPPAFHQRLNTHLCQSWRIGPWDFSSIPLQFFPLHLRSRLKGSGFLSPLLDQLCRVGRAWDYFPSFFPCPEAGGLSWLYEEQVWIFCISLVAHLWCAL